jgi:hypothetical protein
MDSSSIPMPSVVFYTNDPKYFTDFFCTLNMYSTQAKKSSVSVGFQYEDINYTYLRSFNKDTVFKSELYDSEGKVKMDITPFTEWMKTVLVTKHEVITPTQHIRATEFVELMDNRSKQEIWFINKCQSRLEMYCLADYENLSDRVKYSMQYLQGRYDAVKWSTEFGALKWDGKPYGATAWFRMTNKKVL